MNEFLNVFESWNAWGWMTVGVLLMIAELFVPGSFVMWFGFGALLTGVVVALVAGLTTAMQIFIFVGMSVISLIFGFFVYRKFFGRNVDKAGQIKTGAERYIGKSFTVSETIQNGKGKVVVGDTVWLARASQKIAKGSEVVVVGVEGTQLLVEPK